MLRLRFLVGSVLSSILVLAGCHQSQQESVESIRPASKTVGNARFNFFADIPEHWEAENRSANGDGLFLVTGNENADVRIYGGHQMPDFNIYQDMSEDPVYKSSRFRFADGKRGIRLEQDGELYFVRVEKDANIVLYAGGDQEWLEANDATLKHIATSIRRGRSESEEVANSIRIRSIDYKRNPAL